MKTIKRYSKRLALIFAALIFLQGCTVYKMQNLSLDEAAAKSGKVKVWEKNGETIEYRNISKIDNEYFGAKKVKGDLTKIPIQKENVEKVRIEDKALSGTLSVFAFFGGVLVVVFGGIIISGEGLITL